MSYPNFPNPARRARILQAHQLRQQGLTLREIAKIMGCAHSTVAGYLRDYELFRVDLMRELAADQIVSHAIQLAEVDSEHHDRRLAAMREFRLLLTALPEIRRDEDDRTRELTSGQVHVDRYGNRYATPNRMFPPTQEEQQESLEPPLELPAGRPDPDVALYCPPLPVPTPEPQPTAAQDDHTDDHVRTTTRTTNPTRSEQNRTNPNKNPPKIQPRTPNPTIPTKIPPTSPSTRPSNSSTNSSNPSSARKTGTPSERKSSASSRKSKPSKPNEPNKPKPSPRRTQPPPNQANPPLPLEGELPRQTNPLLPLEGELSRSD